MQPGLSKNKYEKNAPQARFFMKQNAPQARLIKQIAPQARPSPNGYSLWTKS